MVKLLPKLSSTVYSPTSWFNFDYCTAVHTYGFPVEWGITRKLVLHPKLVLNCCKIYLNTVLGVSTMWEKTRSIVRCIFDATAVLTTTNLIGKDYWPIGEKQWTEDRQDRCQWVPVSYLSLPKKAHMHIHTHKHLHDTNICAHSCTSVIFFNWKHTAARKNQIVKCRNSNNCDPVMWFCKRKGNSSQKPKSTPFISGALNVVKVTNTANFHFQNKLLSLSKALLMFSIGSNFRGHILELLQLNLE